jgi:hypothetical protein
MFAVIGFGFLEGLGLLHNLLDVQHPKPLESYPESAR